MTRETLIGILSGVASAAMVGLAVWAFGLNQSVGDLDARTKAFDVGLDQARAIVQQNAQQIGQNAQQIASLAEGLKLLQVSVDNLVRSAVEERQAAREDMKDLRDLTRANASAIQELVGQQRQR